METTAAARRRRRNVRTLVPLAVTALAVGIAFTSSTPVTAAPTAKSTMPAYGTFWVVNVGDDTGGFVTEYARSANGNVAPTGTIRGDKTDMDGPNAIAVTSTGALWVAQTSGGAITQYAPGATGNAKPTRVLAGPKTGIDIPIAIAVAPDGSLWVMDNGTNKAILHFADNANGNVAPLTAISGSNTGFAGMRGIAVTPDRKHVWVERTKDTAPSSALLEFSTKATGDVAPTAEISGDKTSLGEFPYGIAINAANQVIVGSDEGPNAILTYAAGAHGNVAPIRSVTGPKSLVTEPSFLALDALGNVWAENYAANNVVVFSPTATGDVSPVRVIAGSKTHLTLPNGVAIFSAAPTAPRKVHAAKAPHHKVTLAWKAPKSDGGGIVGYTAYLMKSKHAAWKAVGSTSHKSVTIHLSAKHSYKFAVVATNNDGSSPRSPSASV